MHQVNLEAVHLREALNMTNRRKSGNISQGGVNTFISGLDNARERWVLNLDSTFMLTEGKLKNKDGNNNKCVKKNTTFHFE